MGARDQLADEERLGQVVVRAELQPEYLVDLVGLYGEHEDRVPQAGGAHLAQHVEAAPVGKAHVEDDEVRRALPHPLERAGAGGLPMDVEALQAEALDEAHGDPRVVLDDEDLIAARFMHHVSLPSPWAAAVRLSRQARD